VAIVRVTGCEFAFRVKEVDGVRTGVPICDVTDNEMGSVYGTAGFAGATIRLKTPGAPAVTVAVGVATLRRKSLTVNVICDETPPLGGAFFTSI